MNRLVDLPFARVLQMPLRDAFRGLSTLAGLTEEAFEPLGSVLPERVRSNLAETFRRIEGMGADAIRANVSLEDIRQAVAALTGKARRLGNLKRCAIVFAFAWDRAFEHEDIHPLLSETLASARLSQTKGASGSSPGKNAATILRLLRDTHVAGGVPGLPLGLSESERTVIDLHLFAITIWLLSVRAATMDEEMQLLDMALALTCVFEREVMASINDHDTLAATLDHLSEHL